MYFYNFSSATISILVKALPTVRKMQGSENTAIVLLTESRYQMKCFPLKLTVVCVHLLLLWRTFQPFLSAFDVITLILENRKFLLFNRFKVKLLDVDYVASALLK